MKSKEECYLFETVSSSFDQHLISESSLPPRYNNSPQPCATNVRSRLTGSVDGFTTLFSPPFKTHDLPYIIDRGFSRIFMYLI